MVGRRGAGRHAKGEDKEGENEEEVAVSGADAKLAALVEELDVEVESRCATLDSDAQRMVAWIRSQYRMQVEKLTKKVRAMTVRELFAGLPDDLELELAELRALADKHRGAASSDAEAQEDNGMASRTPLRVISNANGSQTVLRTTRAASKQSNPTGTARKRLASEVDESAAPRTTRRAGRANGVIESVSAAPSVAATPICSSKHVPCTPAVGTSKASAAMTSTCLRLPKRGESILNARGSPMGTFKHDATAQVILDDHNRIASMAVGVGEETLDVADPEVVARLPKEARLKAAQNVLAMQQQLEAMLAALRA